MALLAVRRILERSLSTRILQNYVRTSNSVTPESPVDTLCTTCFSVQNSTFTNRWHL